MLFFISFSGLVNALSSTILGGLVFWKNKKNVINRAFALFCLSVAFWSYPYIMWPLSQDPENFLFWFRVLHIGAIFIPVLYLRFVVLWLGIKKRVEDIIFIGYFLSGFFLLICFTPWLIKDVTSLKIIPLWGVPGFFYHFYVLYFVAYALFSFYLLYSSYLKASGIKKAQIKFSLIGIFLNFIGGITNFFLWYGIAIPPYGNILASSYVFFTAYAIIKYQLMDIRFFLRKISVYTLSFLVVGIVMALMHYFFHALVAYVGFWEDFGILIIAVFVFSFVKKYFSSLSNRYIFSSLYSEDEVIEEINSKLQTMLDLKEVCGYLTDFFSAKIESKNFALFFQDKISRKYQMRYLQKDSSDNFLKIEKDNGLVLSKKLEELYFRKNKPVIIDEIVESEDRSLIESATLLGELEVELAIPLKIKDNFIGFMALGKKMNKKNYSSQDISMLCHIGRQIALQIENMFLYNEIKNYNIKLRKEIKIALKKYVDANYKLTKLNEVKNNFISIASHKLRTPISVIKGYSSMLLDGEMGEMSERIRSSVENINIANRRLLDMIENLLDVSRIDSGEMKFKFECDGLEAEVEKIFNKYFDRAREKGINLMFKKPMNLPKVLFDRRSMDIVIGNLIDNAINYTAKGKIVIGIEKAKNKIIFWIKDTGIGFERDDKINLFEKFYRGAGTSVLHTEGTGLGLYFANKIIKIHRGRLYAESDGCGKGAIFCFELPLVQ